MNYLSIAEIEKKYPELKGNWINSVTVKKIVDENPKSFIEIHPCMEMPSLPILYNHNLRLMYRQFTADWDND